MTCQLLLASPPLCCLQDIDDGDTSQVHHRFVSKALQPLVALLLEQLVKQDVRMTIASQHQPYYHVAKKPLVRHHSYCFDCLTQHEDAEHFA